MVNAEVSSVERRSLLFGPGSYDVNVDCLSRPNLENGLFREPTTAESISAIYAHYQNSTDHGIFSLGKIQLGRVLRTPLGIVANPPRDENGLSITDLEVIKQLIASSERIQVQRGSIYLGNNDFGFAEYGSFQEGSQNSSTFAYGGLARILEHTPGIAEKIRQISSREVYKDGVSISGFNPLKKVEERIAVLGPFEFGNWLGIDDVANRYEDSAIIFGILK